MPGPDRMYTDRARAESFGSVAAQYDRYRPDYPQELIDDLVALRPAEVLDVGCGTGKAARQLTARGLSVLGVEIDDEMAAVARGHGLTVEVCAFEQWDDAGRRFDLIVSGQAWHWIDPARGPAKAAGLLRPGGTFAVFWNEHSNLADGVRAELDAVYRRYAPELLDLAERDRARGAEHPYLADLRDSGAFGAVWTRHYHYERAYTADEWVGATGTHSDHLLLAPDRRERLARALREAIGARLGGTVLTRGGTFSIWATPRS